MSVASALNLTREAVQAIIVEQWPGWAARLPALLRVDHPADLDRWLRDADPAAADEPACPADPAACPADPVTVAEPA